MAIPKTPDKVKTMLIENVRNAVEACLDSDLANSVLYQLSSHRSEDCEMISIKLGVSEERIRKVIDILEDREIVITGKKFDNRVYINLEESSKTYFETNPYGPIHLVQRKGLTEKQALAAMESVDGSVKFRYSRRFVFDPERLREFGRTIDRDLMEIRYKERGFFYTEMGVPVEFTEGLPSFVSKVDPTKYDGYDNRNFDLNGEFYSARDAFRVGFDEAYGFVILPKMMDTGLGLGDRVKGIEVMKRGQGYNLKLDNLRYNVHRGSFECQQEAKRLGPILQIRLEDVLK